MAGTVAQLRVYTIRQGKMHEFVDAWSRGVHPLRLKHGFRIEGAWVLEEESKFVWVVSYDGPESWEEKEARYYASAERKAMDPDPAKHIALAETWFVTPALPSHDRPGGAQG